MKTRLLLWIMSILFSSAVSAQPWQIKNSGTANNLNAVAFSDKQNGVIAGDNGTVKSTTDGGATWTPASGIPQVHYRGATPRHPRADSLAPGFLVVGQSGNILKRDGNTGTWQNLTTFTSNALNDIQVDPGLGQTAFAVGENGTIAKSLDGGDTWGQLNVPAAAGKWLTKVSIDPTNPDKVTIVGDNGFVLQTNDGGTSWSNQSLPGNIYLGSVFYTGPNSGWASGSDGLLNSFIGSVFTPYTLGTTNGIMGLGFANENFGYGFGDNGYITHWDGSTWTEQTSPTTNWLNGGTAIAEYQKSFPSDYTVYAWAVGQNGTLISTVQSVVGLKEQPSADGFLISPNPCNGHFIVKGPISGEISLEIFDISGRRLADTRTSINAECDFSSLKPGVYTIRFISGNSAQLHKLIVRTE